MTTIDTIAREIKYSRQDRDYACYVDGQYIGSCANYSDAETLCDQVIYDLIADGQCATAAELDGGASVEAIAADRAACPTCEGEGRIPAGGWGDQAGGYAQTCPDCEGAGCSTCDGTPLTEDEIAADYACSEAHPCDRPNHNHSRNYCSAAAAPILAPALLAEADAALSVCPGAFAPCGAPAHPSYAPYCQWCALVLDRVEAAAYIQRLAEDSGLACAYCGEAHAAADCPLRRPLVVPGPRVCGNCGGAHSIQRCDELRAALFAGPCAQAAATQRKPNLIVSQGDGWHVEYDRATGAFAAIIDGVGCVGRHAKPHAAQALVRAHRR